MISWSTITYGAVLSALAAAALTASVNRQARLAAVAGAAALVAPLGWNAVLRATRAHEFFTDAPIAVMPASWQDTGSGIATFALAAALLDLARSPETVAAPSPPPPLPAPRPSSSTSTSTSRWLTANWQVTARRRRTCRNNRRRRTRRRTTSQRLDLETAQATRIRLPLDLPLDGVAQFPTYSESYIQGLEALTRQ